MTLIRIRDEHSSEDYELRLADIGQRTMTHIETVEDKGERWKEIRVQALYDEMFSDHPEPSTLQVTAIDGFYARIPWSMIEQCSFRFHADDDSTDDLRLKVSGDADACLNVKSIVDVRFLHTIPWSRPEYGKLDQPH